MWCCSSTVFWEVHQANSFRKPLIFCLRCYLVTSWQVGDLAFPDIHCFFPQDFNSSMHACMHASPVGRDQSRHVLLDSMFKTSKKSRTCVDPLGQIQDLLSNLLGRAQFLNPKQTMLTWFWSKAPKSRTIGLTFFTWIWYPCEIIFTSKTALGHAWRNELKRNKSVIHIIYKCPKK